MIFKLSDLINEAEVKKSEVTKSFRQRLSEMFKDVKSTAKYNALSVCSENASTEHEKRFCENARQMLSFLLCEDEPLDSERRKPVVIAEEREKKMEELLCLMQEDFDAIDWGQ